MSSEHEHAIRVALDLARHVESGGDPPTMPPSVPLQPGELQHGRAGFQVWLFYPTAVRTQKQDDFLDNLTSAGLWSALWEFFFRDAERWARWEARVQNLPQWRWHGDAWFAVTNQRLVWFDVETWTSYRLEDLVEVRPEPRRYSVTLVWGHAPPMYLAGAWAPWLSVLLFAIRHGTPWMPGTDYRQAFDG